MRGMKHPNIIAATILGAAIVLAAAIIANANRYELFLTSGGTVWTLDKKTGTKYLPGGKVVSRDGLVVRE